MPTRKITPQKVRKVSVKKQSERVESDGDRPIVWNLDPPSSKDDPKLGASINKMLVKKGIETPMIHEFRDSHRESARKAFMNGIEEAFTFLGLDLSDDSLSETPKRVSNMFCDELFAGLDYSRFPKCTAVENKARYDELVVLDRLPVMSVCEHHLQTIDGFARIAYIPNKKVMGLSKFARITEFFSRRPQIQERLTLQIHATLVEILKTEDVAVVIKARHYCMKARGVNAQESLTATSKMTGKFMKNSALRQEFLSLIDSREA